jgi:SAM-dependent methyltransferase
LHHSRLAATGRGRSRSSYLARVPESHEFDQRYFDRLSAVRDHWWIRGMQMIGAALLGQRAGDVRVLDAGSGSGALLPWAHELAAPRPAFGIDVALPAVEECRRLGLGTQLAVASAAQLPLADSSFDLVLSSDVLQHLPAGADARSVHEIARVLVAGGRTLVRTNCAQGRSHVREHDTWRMYRTDTLRALLEEGGLEVEALTPVNFVQGLWSTLSRPLARRRSGSESAGEFDDLTEQHRATHGLGIPEPTHPLKNRVLLQLLEIEAWYLSRPGRRLPFGHSLYAVARKP